MAADPALLDVVRGHMPDVMEDVAGRAERQNEGHPACYPPTRDGVRLGLAAAWDELEEARLAHRSERRATGWDATYDELLDLAAVVVRLAAGIRGDAVTRAHAAAWVRGEESHAGEDRR